MLKKFFHVLLGKPTGYISPADNFLTELRERRFPKASVSQQKEIDNQTVIDQLRDGHAPAASKTKLWRSF